MIRFSKEKLKEILLEYSKLSKSDTILMSDNKMTEENLNWYLEFVNGLDDKDEYIATVRGLLQQLKNITKFNNPILYGFGVPVSDTIH